MPEAVRRAVAAYGDGKLSEAERLCRAILAVKPDFFDVLRLLAMVQMRLGHANDALADRALAVCPKDAVVFNNRGTILQKLKRFEEALASYEQAIALRPDYADALYNRGVLLQAWKRFDQALVSYDQALMAQPNHAAALNNRSAVLRDLKRFEDALASYKQALAVCPDDATAFNNIGVILQELKRSDEALASYERAIALRPDYADAFYNRGVLLHELKRFDETLASYEQALAMQPDYAEALNRRGNVLRELKRFDEALASYEQALAVRPNYAEALNNRGNTLREVKRFGEALASYEQALLMRPDFPEALNNRGNTLRALKRFEDALESYEQALAVRPNYAEALNNRGNTLREVKRFGEALVSYEKAISLEPDHKHALSGLASCAIKVCDWTRRDTLSDEVRRAIREHTSIIAPHVMLSYSSDQSLQLLCAKNYIQERIFVPPQPLWGGEIWRNEKIKVAYVSGDFRAHALAYPVVELFERHDRSKFEVIGISLGPDDRSEMRTRLMTAFDRFIEVATKSDEDVARLINDLRVDIAVDLQGYHEGARPGIFAFRPAPIQVNYLAFPGTVGADFIDYIIADATVLPLDQQPHYSEKIVHLPGCYQVNDQKRIVAPGTPSREEAGLPVEGFVFCCFNNNWKITPAIFNVWMRLLGALDGSVLWLLNDNEHAVKNLRKEAAARIIDPKRLVFAERISIQDHLARHRLADLFLDTLPYNAHATANDALWAGLPVLTCQGEAFAGRVAASLLKAIGLSDLVTHTLEQYEALALRLARDRNLLRGYQDRLAENRLNHPLFDTNRFRPHIEAAYFRMWELWQQNEKPKSFEVAAKGLQKVE
jgi:protein O-GlcNAc transferase